MSTHPDSHIKTGSRSGSTVAREDIEGPVPMRHRNRLGEDIISNPNGEGKPSTKPMIANQPRKGW